MNKKTIITIILFSLSSLAFIPAKITHSDSHIKIHRSYTFFSMLTEPLVIIDNEEQYNNFINNSKTRISTYKLEPFKHTEIDFNNQCVILLSAPSRAPVVKDINYNYAKNKFIIDVEYSEEVFWSLGILGTAIIIDRLDEPIILSEKSLNQHERIYGRPIQCIKNSVNQVVDGDIMDICNISIIRIFNDIQRLKKQFRELKTFNKDSVRINPESNELAEIDYINRFPRFFLSINIDHPIKPPIHIGVISGPSFTFTVLKEKYENICVKVEVRMNTSSSNLKKEILDIINKHLEPLEELNKKDIYNLTSG